MKVKYENAANSVHELVEKLINAYPDKFIHVNINDLCLMYKDSDRSSYRAKTRVLSPLFQKLTNKKILIEIHKGEWESVTDSQRALILYRELFHIGYNEEKASYVLRRHDVKDYHELIKTFGLDYEKANEVFDPLVAKPEATQA